MKSMIKQKPWIRDYLLIFIGTALMSIALKSAFDTNGIVDGGFSGIAIIVKSVTEPLLPGGIPLGVDNLPTVEYAAQKAYEKGGESCIESCSCLFFAGIFVPTSIYDNSQSDRG